jgi:hypothetical protein
MKKRRKKKRGREITVKFVSLFIASEKERERELERERNYGKVFGLFLISDGKWT